MPVPRRGPLPTGPVAPGGIRYGDRRRIPRGPRLGSGGPLRSDGPAGRPDVHGARQLSRRCGGFRPGGLRHLASRSTGDGPAAATPARDELGDLRARRHRSAIRARQADRRLHRSVRDRLLGTGGRRPARGTRGLLHHRHRDERRLRSCRVQLRTERTRDHRRHGVLVVPGVRPPRHAGAAPRRVRTRPRRRGDRHVDARGVRRVQPAAWTGPRRALQGIRRRGRRHGVGRRRRDPRAGTPVRRPAQRPPDPRRRPRQRGEPGRRQQRPDRPEQAGPGTGDPAGPGRRRTRPGRRRRGRSPRHRHHAGRSHRGVRPAGRLRPRSAPRPAVVARFGEVEPRAHPGRRRSGRRDQNDHGDASRCAAEDAARRPSHPPRRLDRRIGVPAHREPGMAGDRPAPPRGGLLVRHQRHERPRRAGTTGPTAGRRAPRGDRRLGRRRGLVRVGPHRTGVARAGAPAAGLRRRPPRSLPPRRWPARC